jgi:hypothetical protein
MPGIKTTIPTEYSIIKKESVFSKGRRKSI